MERYSVKRYKGLRLFAKVMENTFGLVAIIAFFGAAGQGFAVLGFLPNPSGFPHWQYAVGEVSVFLVSIAIWSHYEHVGGHLTFPYWDVFNSCHQDKYPSKDLLRVMAEM